jgi:hypothetical protein
MTVMRVENGENFFEMGVAIEGDRAIQSRGDAYVTLRVCSAGFSGHNDLWVLGEALSEFPKSLGLLERSLRGEAILKSLSPDELSLRIYAANSRGTLAVEGSTGYEITATERSFWHSVSFGFSFEPQQLTKAISLP